LGYKERDVGLIVHAISFQDFQPMWSWSTTVTDRQTTCDLKTALCTIVHHAVKTAQIYVQVKQLSSTGNTLTTQHMLQSRNFTLTSFSAW